MAYEHLPQAVQDIIGKETEAKLSSVTVERSILDHWVEAYQDANPLYSNEEFANKSKYGSLVAPPGMILSWALDLYWRPDGGCVDREKGMIYYTVKRLLDTPVGVNAGTAVEWMKPVLLGDRVSYTELVTHVSEKKTNRLGTGYWVTYKTFFRNQNEEMVAVQSCDNFIFNPAVQ